MKGLKWTSLVYSTWKVETIQIKIDVLIYLHLWLLGLEEKVLHRKIDKKNKKSPINSLNIFICNEFIN